MALQDHNRHPLPLLLNKLHHLNAYGMHVQWSVACAEEEVANDAQGQTSLHRNTPCEWAPGDDLERSISFKAWKLCQMLHYLRTNGPSAWDIAIQNQDIVIMKSNVIRIGLVGQYWGGIVALVNRVVIKVGRSEFSLQLRFMTTSNRPHEINV